MTVSREHGERRRRPVVVAGIVTAALAVALLADNWVSEFMLEHHSAWLHRAGGWLGRLGATEVVTPAGLVAGGLLSVRRRHLRPLLVVLAAQVLTATTVGFLKELLERPEPLDIVGELGRSFPSGHAAQAVAVYCSLAWLVAERSSAKVRQVARGCAAFLVGVVVASLLVRNSHWLSDFVGGVAIGGAAVHAARASVTPERVHGLTRPLMSFRHRRGVRIP